MSAKEDAELIAAILKGDEKALKKLKKKYAKKAIKATIETVAKKAGLTGGVPGIVAAVAIEAVDEADGWGKWMAKKMVKMANATLCKNCVCSDLKNDYKVNSWWDQKGGACFKDDDTDKTIYGLTRIEVKGFLDWITLSSGEIQIEVMKCQGG